MVLSKTKLSKIQKNSNSTVQIRCLLAINVYITNKKNDIRLDVFACIRFPCHRSFPNFHTNSNYFDTHQNFPQFSSFLSMLCKYVVRTTTCWKPKAIYILIAINSITPNSLKPTPIALFLENTSHYLHFMVPPHGDQHLSDSTPYAHSLSSLAV